MRLLYELAGEDPGCRFSPYCWRTRLALAHKGLPVDTVPVRFTDKALLAFSSQDKVPVLRDGDTVVADSSAIADYLDSTYPDRPPLFAQAGDRALTLFLRHWTERVLQAQILPLIILDIMARLGPDDARYFRDSREARFKRPLEAVAADAPAHRAALKASLAPLRATLADQPFVAGGQPAYADYIVFGAFQWARLASPRDLLEEADAVSAWRERMLDLFDGLARGVAPPG